MEQIQIKQITTINDALIQDINTALDDTVWDIEQGEKFINNKDNILFIAYFENKPAGFLSAYRLQRYDKRKAEVLLYEIAVNEEFRQRGIGKLLIEKLKVWAKEGTADEVWVLTNRSNTAGMRLYKSEGGIIQSTDEQMFTFKI